MTFPNRETAHGGFKSGDQVEVRPAIDILATLDEDACLDGVPFMPEMVEYVGHQFTVYKRVEKICDYFSGGPSRSRYLPRTVLLGALRCDGSAHDGCQARCRFFWNDAWLRDAGVTHPVPDGEGEARAELERRALNAVHAIRPIDGEDEQVFRCQATEAIAASTPLRELDPRPLVRELTSKNVSLPHFTRVATRAVGERVGRKLRLIDEFPFAGSTAHRVEGDRLDLQPGEWVEVRSLEEISSTLDDANKHRGLAFTSEMIPSCGHRFRVQERVERLIDEKNGRMLEFKNDCIMLEGLVCMGDRARGAWFCPREAYPLWREAWLKRIDTSPEPGHGS